jgi:hypothetical protein
MMVTYHMTLLLTSGLFLIMILLLLTSLWGWIGHLRETCHEI